MRDATAACAARLVEVAVPVPVFTTFTYRVPDPFTELVGTGIRVVVPLGRRLLTGYVLGDAAAPPCRDLKDIADVIDREPLFSEQDLRFYRWVADYYIHPLGLTIKTALPPATAIRYEDHARITPLGEQALTDAAADIPGRDILSLIPRSGGIALKQLRTKAGIAGFAYRIGRLAAAGYIEVAGVRARGCVGIRRERWFSPTAAAADAALRGRQSAVLAAVMQQGTVSEQALRQRFRRVAPALAALEKKGLVTVELREAFRLPEDPIPCMIEPEHEPTGDQRRVLAQLESALDKKVFYPLLLHGVTGSGKTEVYLRAMQHVLDRGGQCLYLVPEIALTAQLYDRITSRIAAPTAMLHSGMTDAERFDAWRLIRRGGIKVVVGARSALFAPLCDLGLIVVDEEHDPSYKQEDGLRYHARDMAVVRARMAACPVILGSATPSLESYANTVSGKYHRAVLEFRIADRELPRVSIVPLSVQARTGKPAPSVLSEPLRRALAERLNRGQQSILFLNRRGFAPVYSCQTCGAAVRCPNCAVSLIYHRADRRLACHYCGVTLQPPQECPACGSYFLAWLGWGTERLAAELAALFPGARIGRMDRDATARRGAVRDLLTAAARGEIDILVGTQMLVKGYHLPSVTLVGVVCADQSLHFPDYRASERTFQLLTQVAGRAGRGDVPGEVIIQTYVPDHYSIRCARQHDFKTFYRLEMQNRRELRYPPYAKLVMLRFEGNDRRKVERYASAVGDLCRRLNTERREIEVLGPCPAPLEKIRGKYRYHLMLRASRSESVRSFAKSLLEAAEREAKERGVTMIVDVDPLQVM